MLTVSFSVRTRTYQLPTQDIFEPQLMLIWIKVFRILVQTVVSQVDITVFEVALSVILSARKPDESIIKQINLHGTDRRSDKHINPKIILVIMVQCWSFHILLNYVLNLIFVDRSVQYLFSLLLGYRFAVVLGCFDALLNF